MSWVEADDRQEGKRCDAVAGRNQNVAVLFIA